VRDIYSESWVNQYFNYDLSLEGTIEGRDEDEHLILFKTSTNQLLTDKRFSVFVHIPEKSKKYFLPEVEWKTSVSLRDLQNNVFIPVEKLSFRPNAFSTKPYPYTESQSYQSPFFIIFKSGNLGQCNFLKFVDFFKPNSESCILSMLHYDTDEGTFYPKCSLGVTLQASNTLLLSNVLEFIIVDSKKNIVDVEDNSQLYISIKLLAPMIDN